MNCNLKTALEDAYCRFNKREFVHPDPLEFLYEYEDSADREIVGLIASGLAYGGVKQILKSVSHVLSVMGSPHEYVLEGSFERFLSDLKTFKHRFTTGEELAFLLKGVKQILETKGSLHECFASGFSAEDEDIIPAMSRFRGELASAFPARPRSLLPDPLLGSACKRLNLYFRWMVRKDEVDPGGWNEVTPDKLLVPVDVHMHRIATELGFTSRKQANLHTAREITACFREFEPADPVRFDFALTRFGIRDDCRPGDFLDNCGL